MTSIKLFIVSNISDLAEHGNLSREDTSLTMSRLRSHLDKSLSDREECDVDLFSLSHTSVSSRGSTESGIGVWLPAEQRLEELHMKYKTLVEELLEYFQKNVTSEMITKKLRLAPVELKQLKAYLHIRDSNSDDLFTEVIKVSNFRYMPVMQQLVREVGNEKCKRAMLSYREDLFNFNVETTLGEYAKGRGSADGRGSDGVDEREIVLKMGGKWANKSLQDFEEFKKKLQKRAHFDMHALQLQGAALPCLGLTLAVASNSADVSNIKHVETDFFKLNNVLRVSLGDDIIYNVESPKVNTPS